MNIWDILIIALLLAVVIPAVLRLRRGRGGCSCGGSGGCAGCSGCAACARRDNCRKRERKQETEQ